MPKNVTQQPCAPCQQGQFLLQGQCTSCSQKGTKCSHSVFLFFDGSFFEIAARQFQKMIHKKIGKQSRD